MSKKFFTTESLATLVNEIKKYVANAILTKADSSHSHTITDVDSLQDTLNAKATQNSLDSHVSDTDKHITETERTNWNAAKTHADSAHVTSINGMSGDVVVDIPTDYITTIPEEYVTEDELTAKGYLTSFTETDPTVPAWAKAENKPAYTAEEVGADPVGTATSVISTHNTAIDSHNDIRLLIDGLTTRLNTLADSDDTTLDQMSEIVAYIKSNKSLIEDVTTNKVSVSDIIDNLTTNVANKPLSAAQGVALKALIDALDIDKLDASALTSAVNDALAQAKASGEFDGTDGVAGKDGTSVTHSWSGTTLTVTSASGTSSADLKGDKGDKGDSPVRGTDYWTEEDKAEIKSYVDEAILGGAW